MGRKIRYSESLAKRNGNSFRGDGRHWFERNDCSVIALAYAFDIPYIKAHELCKKSGRVDCHGFLLNDIFRLGQRKKSRQFKGRRIGYHPRRPGMSVGKFREKHPEGIYIITVGGHVFTMVDGKLLNQTNLNDRISYYFYVTKPSLNDSTFGQQELDNPNPICKEDESIEARCEQVDQPGQTGSEVY